MTDLPLERLLWPPMPDPLPPPASRRSRRLRHLLVREAYLASLAEQDDVHRRPDAFAQAWKAHLAA